MTKVPHCKGSYQKRRSGDGWQLKYPLGWSEAKLKYDEYREEFSSEAEAIAALKDINDFIYHGGKPKQIAEHRGKAVVVAKKLPTVEEFAKTFCQIRRDQGKVAARTIDADWDCLSRVIPYLGKISIDEVTPQQIDEMYAAMRRGDPRNKTNRAYSGTTLQKTHCSLSLLFSKAIDYGYLDKNPCLKVEKPKRDTKEKQCLSAEEANALFAAIVEEPLTAHSVGVLLALCCGTRLSEMLALTWADYNNGFIDINKSQLMEKQETKETKNGEARVVPCPPPLVDVLEEWRAIQKRWYAKNDLKWSKKCAIVNSSVGNHMLQRSFSKWFTAEVKKYPIPDDFTYHGLRHTFVTLMNRDCAIDDRTTRAMSGHKSNQAFQIYTHTDDAWMREAANRYGAIVAPRTGKKQCRNCKHWTVSPNDEVVGACWASRGEGVVSVTECISACPIDAFEMKLGA